MSPILGTDANGIQVVITTPAVQITDATGSSLATEPTDVTDDRVNLIDVSSNLEEEASNSNELASATASHTSHQQSSFSCENVASNHRSTGTEDDLTVSDVSNVGKKKKFEKTTIPPENKSDESVVCQSRGSSNSSITCRICQLSETESGEPVKTSDCQCRGYLEAIHRSCLLEWIRYKGSRICEVCAAEFSSVPAPRRPSSHERRQQELETLFRQYASLRPLTQRKRAFVGSLLVLLVIVSAIAGVFTVSTDKRFRSISSNPWSSLQSIHESYIMFSICLSFLLFSTAVTFGTLLTWCTLEVTYHYQRQRVWQRAVRIAASNQNAV